MAKRIDYKITGYLCESVCPHTGKYIGSIPCSECQYYEHKRTREQLLEEINTGKKMVLCNYPDNE